MRLLLRSLWALPLVLSACVHLRSPAPLPPPLEWRYHGGDAASTRFAPISGIDSTNFERLRVVWRWSPPDLRIRETGDVRINPSSNECAPLMVDGTLYVISPYNIVAALDAATGRELWTFDPEAWKVDANFNVSRGVAYWSDGARRRILAATSSAYLHSLDAVTGEPDRAFGDNGRVDLTRHLRRPPDRYVYGVSSPPMVCGDVAIVGSSHSEWDGKVPEFLPLGDVRGFDARTGELLWTFHTVPQAGEFGNETWEEGSWKRYGGANVWAPMSADLDLGYAYLPVSAPSHDFYGGERPGDNLFSETLACVDCASGRRIWHYQLIHHGIWDYDVASAPILMDVSVEGRPVKAVVQLTKQAFAFVFDRVTGEPLWPVEERPVPQSSVPGERASPTQPFPTRPLPFDRQGLGEEDLIGFTPELREQALEIAKRHDSGPLFTPPSERGTWTLPGGLGGADWGGGAAHPNGWVYVPSRTSPSVFGLREAGSETSFSRYDPLFFSSGGPQGLPLVKPPYGRITAIDVNTGEHRWMVPNGLGPVDHPALRELDLPPLGWDARVFVLTTPEMLIAASQPPDRLGNLRGRYRGDAGKRLSAYDLLDGRLIARVPLPGNASGNPVAYTAAGRDYIAVPMIGWGGGPEWVGLAFPRPREQLPPQGHEAAGPDPPSLSSEP